MEKPMRIGFLIGIAILFVGCARRDQGEFVSINPTRSSDTDLIDVSRPNSEPVPLMVSIPIDDEAKRLGTKVFTKMEARLLRSPRDGAPEYYRVAPGFALFVSPTADKKWLQVRLSKGRSAYVRTDSTSAALKLALAQQAIADKQRLAPKAGPNSEPDVGDGKGGNPGERDPALDAAIEELHTAFDAADDEFDRLRAEVAGFQGAQGTWPSVRDSVQQHLNALQSAFQDVAGEIQAITALSSKLTANERSAYQSIVIHQGEVTDAIQSIQQTLNQMTDGTDWTSPIATLGENVTSLAGGMDGLRTNLARLG